MMLVNILLLVVALSGCRAHPCRYERVPLDENWTSTPLVDTDPYPDDWWSLFADPTLTSLIETSHVENQSLQSAHERVVQAYYLRKQISSHYDPTIDGALDYERSFSLVPIGALMAPLGSGGNNFIQGVKEDLFLAGFDAKWELDLFRRTYHQVQAAYASEGSTLAAFQAMKVSLSSEIARNYFFLRWMGRREQLLRVEEGLWERKLQLLGSLRRNGIESDQPLFMTKAKIATLKEELSEATSEKKEGLHRLIALLGKIPSSIIDELYDPSSPYPTPPCCVPVGLPAEILRRRADIREAEYKIGEAAAEVDVAVADFFPRLDLTGTMKRERFSLASLSSRTLAWSYGLHLLTPFFHGGKLCAQLREKESLWRQSVHDYYESVITAISEAESSLFAFTNGKRGVEAAEESYHAIHSDYMRVEQLCEAGIIDEITLIDHHIDEVEAMLSYEEALYDQTLRLINLYKSLGGGWETELCSVDPGSRLRPQSR